MTEERRKNIQKRKTVDAVIRTARSSREDLSVDDLLRTLADHEAAKKAFREKERQFRTLIQNIPGAVYRRVPDRSWTVLFISEGIQAISGYPASAFLKNRTRSLRDIVHPDDRDRVKKALADCLERRAPYLLEYRLLHADDRICWVQDKGRGVYGNGGEPAWLDGALFDITEQKRAEKSLRNSETRYRGLFASVPVGLYRGRPGGELEDGNPALLKLLRCPDRKALLAVNLGSIFTDVEQRTQLFTLLEGRGVVHGFEAQGRRFDGSRFWMRVTARAVYDEQGEMVLHEGAIEDITESCQVRQALSRAKQEWEWTFDTVPDLVAVIDGRYRIRRVNRALADRLGIAPKEAVGQPCYRLFHRTDKPPESCLFPDLGDERTHAREVYEEHLGGHFALTVSPLRDSRGRVVGSVHVARDINAQKKMAKELERSRAFLQTVIDGVADVIVVIDRNYEVRLANRAARERYFADVSDSEYPFCYGFFHGRNRRCAEAGVVCTLETVLKDRKTVHQFHEHQMADGTRYPVEIVASPLFDEAGDVSGVVAVGRDMTEKQRMDQEQQRLESRLFEQQKEQSIVTLAGGLAHEFNNILTGVIGNAELLEARYNGEDDSARMARTIIDGGQRLAHLTRELLAYARGGRQATEAVDLNAMIRTALDLVEKGTASRVRRNVELEPEPWPVMADPAQLQQVFVNILTNACEAMAAEGGILTIRTLREHRDTAWECHRHDRHLAGDYMVVAVTDTAGGISENALPRIFDPFFTTKFTGRGLGLSAALGIVRGHDGCIEVETRPGVGTTFRVVLPRTESAAEPHADRLDIQTEAALPPVQGKILVVDDDPQVLRIVREILMLNGFDVVTAGGGYEAVRIFDHRKADIGLVVLDVQMPDMSGQQVYDVIKSLKSDVRVLVASGFDEKRALEGIRLADGDGFIQKPLLRSVFVKAVRALLAGRPAAG